MSRRFEKRVWLWCDEAWEWLKEFAKRELGIDLEKEVVFECRFDLPVAGAYSPVERKIIYNPLESCREFEDDRIPLAHELCHHVLRMKGEPYTPLEELVCTCFGRIAADEQPAQVPRERIERLRRALREQKEKCLEILRQELFHRIWNLEYSEDPDDPLYLLKDDFRALYAAYPDPKKMLDVLRGMLHQLERICEVVEKFW